MFFLNNTKQILQSAIDCKKYSSSNCEGCPHLNGDYYTGEFKDDCFESIMMDCTTNDKGEIIIQIHQLGYKDYIKYISNEKSQITKTENELLQILLNKKINQLKKVNCKQVTELAIDLNNLTNELKALDGFIM